MFAAALKPFVIVERNTFAPASVLLPEANTAPRIAPGTIVIEVVAPTATVESLRNPPLVLATTLPFKVPAAIKPLSAETNPARSVVLVESTRFAAIGAPPASTTLTASVSFVVLQSKLEGEVVPTIKAVSLAGTE